MKLYFLSLIWAAFEAQQQQHFILGTIACNAFISTCDFLNFACFQLTFWGDSVNWYVCWNGPSHNIVHAL